MVGEIDLDGEWLESLYDPKELISGKQLRLHVPWPEKGEEKYWNAVLMEPKQEISSCDITYSNTPSSSKGKTTRKRKAPSKHLMSRNNVLHMPKDRKNVSTSYPPPSLSLSLFLSISLSVLFAFDISIVRNIPVLVGTTEKPKGKILRVGGASCSKNR